MLTNAKNTSPTTTKMKRRSSVGKVVDGIKRMLGRKSSSSGSGLQLVPVPLEQNPAQSRVAEKQLKSSAANTLPQQPLQPPPQQQQQHQQQQQQQTTAQQSASPISNADSLGLFCKDAVERLKLQPFSLSEKMTRWLARSPEALVDHCAPPDTPAVNRGLTGSAPQLSEVTSPLPSYEDHIKLRTSSFNGTVAQPPPPPPARSRAGSMTGFRPRADSLTSAKNTVV